MKKLKELLQYTLLCAVLLLRAGHQSSKADTRPASSPLKHTIVPPLALAALKKEEVRSEKRPSFFHRIMKSNSDPIISPTTSSTKTNDGIIAYENKEKEGFQECYTLYTLKRKLLGVFTINQAGTHTLFMPEAYELQHCHCETPEEWNLLCRLILTIDDSPEAQQFIESIYDAKTPRSEREKAKKDKFPKKKIEKKVASSPLTMKLKRSSV